MIDLQQYKKYAKILQGLIEKPEMTFQQVVDLTNNRTETLLKISKLIQMGLIRDGRIKPGVGRARQLELTDKGETVVFEMASKDLNAAFETVKRIIARVAQDPSKIKKWQVTRRKAFYALRVPQNLPDQQKGQIVREHVSQHQKRWDRQMLECLRIVHEVYLSTEERAPGAGSLIGITKLGDSYVVKVVPEKQVSDVFPGT